MHHPELEQRLAELQKLKHQAAQDLRDLATEAVENADRASKTMMMYLDPSGLRADCSCTGKLCMCPDSQTKTKRPTSRLFIKVKKALNSKGKRTKKDE